MTCGNIIVSLEGIWFCDGKIKYHGKMACSKIIVIQEDMKVSVGRLHWNMSNGLLRYYSVIM